MVEVKDESRADEIRRCPARAGPRPGRVGGWGGWRSENGERDEAQSGDLSDSQAYALDGCASGGGDAVGPRDAASLGDFVGADASLWPAGRPCRRTAAAGWAWVASGGGGGGSVESGEAGS